MRYFSAFILIMMLFFSCNDENKAQNSIIKNIILKQNIPKVSDDYSTIDTLSMGISFFPSGNYGNNKSKICNHRIKHYQELSKTTDTLKKIQL